MFKKITVFVLLVCLVLSFAACGAKDGPETDSGKAQSQQTESLKQETEQETEGESETAAQTPAQIRVAGLKGPTTMGIVHLKDKAEKETLFDTYTFTMATQADEVAAALIKGNVDIALIPANLAAVVYQKSSQGIAVVDINTAGVLYCVTGRDDIKGIKDLAGKTVILTGQGTTPEYSLRYLLAQNQVDDCTLEFKSEATEVAAALAADANQIAVLPQPFATVAQVQNSALKEAFSLESEWNKLGLDSKLLTGVTVVRRAFFEEHPDAVARFLALHEESAKAALENVAATAELVAANGIIEKAPIAQKALPKCAICCVYGQEMKAALSGYLQVLFDQNPASVGGQMPGENFYLASLTPEK